MNVFKRRDVAGDKARYKDNIAWWMNRYETLITTEAEDVVRNAVTMFNDAVAILFLLDDLLHTMRALCPV